ncbi:hypothetical protein KI387_026725, partial [Taxus chinensis]
VSVEVEARLFGRNERIRFLEELEKEEELEKKEEELEEKANDLKQEDLISAQLK